MKPNFEKTIKEFMSANSPDIPEPDSGFLTEAHERINKRKKNASLKSSIPWLGWLMPENQFYQSAIVVVVVLLFAILLPRTNQHEGLAEKIINESRSASSSTVLAGLNHQDEPKPSVNSATVLTSIVTFASKN